MSIDNCLVVLHRSNPKPIPGTVTTGSFTHSSNYFTYTKKKTTK